MTSLVSRIRIGLYRSPGLSTSFRLSNLLDGVSSYSGKSVTVENSLGLIPVWAAVNRLTFAVGASPLHVYSGNGANRKREEGASQWDLLRDEPNDEMAADEFWSLLMSHLLLWGNAFAFKFRDNGRDVSGLWPIEPSRVMVGRAESGARMFVLDGDLQSPFGEDKILQIRGLSSDGLVGYSPIQMARQQLGNSLAMEEFQGRFWKNGAWPGVVLKHPNKLSPEVQARLKATWDRAHGGYGKAGSTAILEEGMDVTSMTMPLEDAQFIDQARFSDTRIAQLFGLPPSTIGAKTGDSLTYATVEGNAIQFVRDAVRPWCVRIESSLKRDRGIFPRGGVRLYPKFNLDALLRADTKTRYEAHGIAIDKKIMAINEVRALEDLPPIKGGDEIDLSPPPAPQIMPPAPTDPNPEEGDDADED